tara:strand:+ start:299 stop:1159 length:861 start_codon:yes stop_codon:yes gene_type:complete
MPKYSICIPTYNRSELLINAAESALNQEYEDYEVLIVDNHSDENHQTVIENYLSQTTISNLTYIKNSSNLGMMGNWNKCISFAKGQYVSILSDDDLLAPNFLRNIDSVVNKHPKCSCFVKKEEYEISKPLPDLRKGECHNVSKVGRLNRNIFKWFNGIGTPAGFIFPRSVGSSIGFDTKQHPSSDYDFFINISEAVDIYFLDEVLAYVGIGVNDSLNLRTIYGFIEKDKLLRKKCGQNNAINSALEVFQLNNYLLSSGHKDRKNIFAVIMDLFFKLTRKLIFKWYC